MGADQLLDDDQLAAKYDELISTTSLYYRIRHLTRATDAVFNRLENLAFRKRIAAPVTAPIFPLGNFRSGTSFLEKVIADHFDVGHFTYTSQIFPRAPIITSATVRRVPALNKPMKPFHVPNDVTVESPYEGEPIWRFCTNHCWTDEPSNVLDGRFEDRRFERTLQAAINKHLISQGKSRFVNKNPWNTLRIGYLDKLYPDAKFVYIVRHPHRMLRSQLDLEAMCARAFRDMPRYNEIFSDQFQPPRVFFRTPNSRPYIDLYPDDRVLATAMSIVDIDETFDQQVTEAGLGGRVHRVRYEDLMADFSSEMTRIFEFCELEPGEARRVIADNEAGFLRRDLVSSTAPPPQFSADIAEVLAPLVAKYRYTG
jgi:hypothetical protein